ncbi:MAG: TIGR03857 family LLM class F420-dependent oxidoreductase [Solirubrobacteraceae bacterium]
MSAEAPSTSGTHNGRPLAPVVDDLSAYVIAGAVTSEQGQSEWDTVSRTPAQGIEDGVEAERLGFRRIWLSERIDIKQADVILSGIAARTSRLEVGTGAIAALTRHPWVAAALGATMQACYGPRFVLGIGRGENGYLRGSGIEMASYRQTADYIEIVRALWRGEQVDYDGPLGPLQALSFAETYHGPAPPIWFAGYALPNGARLIAERCDGVMLVPMMTPDAVQDAVTRIRCECERLGRDPASVRITAPVVTAPDLDEFETRAIVHGRAVTYLQYKGHGEALCKVNGWDPSVCEEIRNHRRLAGLSAVADRVYQRHQLLDVAVTIPDRFMEDCSAFGTASECVHTLRRFIDAGADEIATYGSTPAQNAGLIAAWRGAHAASSYRTRTRRLGRRDLNEATPAPRCDHVGVVGRR